MPDKFLEKLFGRRFRKSQPDTKGRTDASQYADAASIADVSNDYSYELYRQYGEWLGNRRNKNGRPKAAQQSGEIMQRTMLEHAIEEFPDEPQPVLDLGVHYEKCQEYDSALKVYEDYNSNYPPHFEVVRAQLDLLLRLARLREAKAVFDALPAPEKDRVLDDQTAHQFMQSMMDSGVMESTDFDEKAVFFSETFLKNARSVADVAREFSDQFFLTYLKTVKDLAGAAGARLVYVSVDNLFSVRNKSETERWLLSRRIWEMGSDRPAWLKSQPSHLTEAYHNTDSFSQDYIAQVFTGPNHILQATKIALPDYESDYVNVRNNMRVTVDAPKNAENRILILGGSDVYGFGCDDAHTIPSLLQSRLLSNQNRQYAVENHGLRGNPLAVCLNNLLQTHVGVGDVLILFGYPKLTEKLSNSIGLEAHHISFSRPHEHGEVYFDHSHLGPVGNAIVAEKVADIINGSEIGNPPASKSGFDDKDIHGSLKYLKYLIYRHSSDLAEAGHLKEYIEYLSQFRVKSSGLIGSVAVNCNPMTLGHLHLLEHAARNVEHLFVFVIEEDLSFFPFRDRIDIVTRGLAHLSNVTVVRGGQFICTQLTFPEYFSKEDASQARADASMEAWFFCEYVAPALGITQIFLGDEPKCVITSQYNAKMAEILPTYGINVEIIARIEMGGSPISASEVRRLLAAKEFDAISKIVPSTTLAYLIDKYS